jgi:hypothetical protein
MTNGCRGMTRIKGGSSKVEGGVVCFVPWYGYDGGTRMGKKMRSLFLFSRRSIDDVYTYPNIMGCPFHMHKQCAPYLCRNPRRRLRPDAQIILWDFWLIARINTKKRSTIHRVRPAVIVDSGRAQRSISSITTTTTRTTTRRPRRFCLEPTVFCWVLEISGPWRVETKSIFLMLIRGSLNRLPKICQRFLSQIHQEIHLN